MKHSLRCYWSEENNSEAHNLWQQIKHNTTFPYLEWLGTPIITDYNSTVSRRHCSEKRDISRAREGKVNQKAFSSEVNIRSNSRIKQGFCEVLGGALTLTRDNKVLTLMPCCNVVLRDRASEMAKTECNSRNFELNTSNYDFLAFSLAITPKNFPGLLRIYTVWGVTKSSGWSVAWWSQVTAGKDITGRQAPRITRSVYFEKCSKFLPRETEEKEMLISNIYIFWKRIIYVRHHFPRFRPQ